MTPWWSLVLQRGSGGFGGESKEREIVTMLYGIGAQKIWPEGVQQHTSWSITPERMKLVDYLQT